MPFTANAEFKQAPRLLAEASGVHYRTEDGRTVLDGMSGRLASGPWMTRSVLRPTFRLDL